LSYWVMNMIDMTYMIAIAPKANFRKSLSNIRDNM
jgi:hypothetical protein